VFVLVGCVCARGVCLCSWGVFVRYGDRRVHTDTVVSITA